MITQPDESAVWAALTDNLRTLMEDLDQEPGEITEATYLGADLGVSSIDVIHLMVGLEDNFQKQLNFDELAIGADGQFRNDITIGELYHFVCGKVVPA